MYEKRFYRDWMKNDGLARFQVVIGESDLLILADRHLEGPATSALEKVRGEIESYILQDEMFKTSLRPYPVGPSAPEVVREMARSGAHWNVGPMAAVAGAVAHSVGRALAAVSNTVIVENGGDVFAVADKPLRFALYAGEGSPFSDRIRFQVDAGEGLGVCTSSCTVGPSLSFGKADAVAAIAGDTGFADAAATSIANQIQGPQDVDRILAEQEERGDLKGVIACCEDRLGLWGEIELVRT